MGVESAPRDVWRADNADFDDLGGDYFGRRGNTARHQDRLVQQLQDLGYQVTLKKIAA